MTKQTDPSGETVFDWTYPNDDKFMIFNNAQHLRLIKVTKRIQTAAQYSSYVDAQEAKVLRNENTWIVTVMI